MKYIKNIFVLVIIPIVVTVIGAIITSTLEKTKLIPGLFSFLEKVKQLFVSVFTFNVPIWIVLLIIVFVTIIALILVSARNKSTKPNMRWFKRIKGDKFTSHLFLLWYPLNGLHTADLHRSTPALRIQIMKSPIINNLLKNKILALDSFGSHFEIADEAYEFLADILKSQYDPSNKDLTENMKNIKEANFPQLVAAHVLESAIKID